MASEATGALAKIALQCKDTQDQLRRILGDGAAKCEAFATGLDDADGNGKEVRADLDAKLNNLRGGWLKLTFKTAWRRHRLCMSCFHRVVLVCILSLALSSSPRILSLNHAHALI